MKRYKSILIAMLTVILAVTIFPSHEAVADEAGPAMSKAQLDQYIRDFILNNPQVIVESVQRMQAQQEQAQQQQSITMLKERQNEVFNDPDDPVSGNVKGDVTIVEFMDYNCGFCRKVFPAVTQLVEEDKNIRIVFKEFPVLGEGSQFASLAALASERQGRYMEFHDAMMHSNQRLAKPQILAIAKKVGLDISKLEEDIKDPQLQAMIDRNYTLAQALAINGTPGFIIGDEIVRGATSLEHLKQLVGKARQQAQ